jgi:hypothetical protein
MPAVAGSKFEILFQRRPTLDFRTQREYRREPRRSSTTCRYSAASDVGVPPTFEL